MKWACVLLVCMLGVASGELLSTLKALHSSDIFHYLDASDQVMLVEVIAATEACKLSAYIHEYGRADIERLIIHMPGQVEQSAKNYITNHLHKENHHTCVVQSGSTTRAPHRG